TAEARQVWEAIQQGKLVPPAAPQPGKSALSPDGKLKAGIEEDGSVSLLDAATGKVLRALRGPGECTSIAFSEDGRRLTAECKDGQRLTWDLATGKLISRANFDSKAR